MRTKTKARLSLVASLGVSLFAVVSASISTYAWFQSNSQASIDSDPKSVTITVAPPDTYELGQPEIYIYDGNGDTGYNNTTDPASGSITTGSVSNFTLLEDKVTALMEDDDTLTEQQAKDKALGCGGLLPGRRMTFGVKLSSKDGVSTMKSATLTLKKYKAKNHIKRYVLSSVTEGGSGSLGTYSTTPTQKIIRIEDIVKLHSAINTSGTFAIGANRVLTNYDKTYNTTGSTYNEKEYSCSYQMATADSFSSATIYFFYTIEFSNESTTWFKEYTKDNNNKYHTCYEIIDKASSSIRYFHADTDGNSTGYEGLTFSMTELEIATL